MIIGFLAILGLAFGSFVNALAWRLRQQNSKTKKQRSNKTQTSTKQAIDLSIFKGRSVCPECKHQLAILDLIPVLSWVALQGKCRYCRKPISWQYPVVELATASLFVASYVLWPFNLNEVGEAINFAFWLAFLVGFMALTLYDLRWHLLPNRIVFPLMVVAVLNIVSQSFTAHISYSILLNSALGAIVGGGFFYVIFQMSQGSWIGGGDVKLGFLLGLILGNPVLIAMAIFIASVLGMLVYLPLMSIGRAHRSTMIPFGPYLIAGAIIVQIFGQSLIDIYMLML